MVLDHRKEYMKGRKARSKKRKEAVKRHKAKFMSLTEKERWGVIETLKIKHLPSTESKAEFLKRKYGGSFYTTVAWLTVRHEVLKRSDRRCVICGNGPKEGYRLHVDHIKPRSKYPLLELNIENLQVLCELCNWGKSNKDEIDWRDK